MEPFESGGFLERLNAKLSSQRLPVSGSLELTFRCNLSCVHCYIGDYRYGRPSLRESNTTEMKVYLDQIADAGCLWLLLTGGEPLVRRDFLEIYLYAKRKGLLLTLFTNATLVTPRIAATLADFPPQAVEITLYGYSQDTYERITDIPGSHAACLRGIELLLKQGIIVKLKTMLMTVNRHELGAMQDFAKNLGVNFRFNALLNAGLDGSCSPHQYRLSPEEVVAYDLEDPDRFCEWKEKSQLYVDFKIDDRYQYTCGAGLKAFHIDPYGRLFPCIMSRLQGYDLRQGSFREGWDVYLSQVRTQLSDERYKCLKCRLLLLCGQCPGWATVENGDVWHPVDYLCRVAHLRAKSLGMSF